MSFYGSVQVVGATSIRLVFPDGTTLDAPLGTDHHFDLTLPAARQGDFARTPGRLVALDAGGGEVASRTVGAVTFWRTLEQGG